MQNTYKEGFVKSKGKVSTVADTPELLRVKKQQDLISQSKYKSEFEKNKGKFTQVSAKIIYVRPCVLLSYSI